MSKSGNAMIVASLATLLTAKIFDDQRRDELRANTRTLTVADTTFTQRKYGLDYHYKAQYPDGTYFGCTLDSLGAISNTKASTIRTVPETVDACKHIESLYH